MDPVTATLLMKDLDGLTARSRATAENIANVNTVNYRPLRVTFEKALAAAAAKDRAAVEQVEPKIEPASAEESQSGVRLDMELATASKTAMRYAAVVELLNQHLQMNSLNALGNS